MNSEQATIRNSYTPPLSDIVRANVSHSRVALPVRGALYARLNHIAAVPARANENAYSLSRLRVIDSMISRMQNELLPAPNENPVEFQERFLQQVAEKVTEMVDRSQEAGATLTGFLVDLLA